MRERAAQELNPEMGRMGAEDPSTAFSAAPLGPASLFQLAQAAQRPGEVAAQNEHRERVSDHEVGQLTGFGSDSRAPTSCTRSAIACSAPSASVSIR